MVPPFARDAAPVVTKMFNIGRMAPAKEREFRICRPCMRIAALRQPVARPERSIRVVDNSHGYRLLTTQTVALLPVMPAMREHVAVGSYAFRIILAALAALPGNHAARTLIAVTETALVEPARRHVRNRYQVAVHVVPV